MMTEMTRSSLFSIALWSCSSVGHATIVDSIGEMYSAIGTAKSGDIIQLRSGNYDDVVLANLHFSSPVTIDARDVRLSIRIQRTSGIIVRGGTFSAGVNGRAVVIDGSESVAIYGGVIEGAVDGVTIVRSRRILVDGVRTSKIAGNAFTVAGSQNITLLNGSCRDQARHPTLHPDCVQVWSLPNSVTSDLRVDGFKISGFGQGIFIRNPMYSPAGLGFDRIKVANNVISTTDAPNGISLHDCRDCMIVNNLVGTAEGSKWQTRIYVAGGAVKRKSNQVRSYARWKAEAD